MKSQTIIVTGAGRGLGHAIAQNQIASGNRVVAVIRSEAQAAALQAKLGGNAVVLVADVADPEAPALAVAAARSHWGQVDGLVNNAGIIGPMMLLTEAEDRLWDETVTVDLLAPARFMRAFIAAQDGSRPARIVNITSGAAHRALRGWSAYCASKAGLAMLTRCLHIEYAAQGVRCFNLIPGLIDTAMQAAVRASGVNEVSTLPREALRPAEEPALAVSLLLSGEADDLAGGDVDIRDPEIRGRARLPAL